MKTLPSHRPGRGIFAVLATICAVCLSGISPSVGGESQKAERNLAEAALGMKMGRLREIDDGYFHRNENGRLDASTAQLRALIGAQNFDPILLWRLGRNLVALAGVKNSQAEKLAVLAEAVEPLKRAIELAPKYPQPHFWLAQEMAAENEIKRKLFLARSMKKELETALDLDPGYEQAHCVYGELLRQLPRIIGGDLARAVKENEEALRLAPNDTANYPALARAYVAVDRLDDAIRILNKVFDVQEPSDPGSQADDLTDAKKLLNCLSNQHYSGKCLD